MAKLTRREFLKYISLLGAISPIFNVDLIRDNLDGFTVEQLESARDIIRIKLSDCSPYCLAKDHTRDDKYYDVYLKDGTVLWLSNKQIKERYGDILDYMLSVSGRTYLDDGYPANFND